MNPDNTTNQNQISPNASQQSPVPPVNKFSQLLTTVKEKIPQPVKDVLIKFYSNKMIFWPITIVFSLLFLTIILGLLFGTKAPQTVKQAPKPTPFINSTPAATPTGDSLSETQFKLTELKDEIKTLDVRQSPIKPPTMDFDVKF